MKYRRKHGIIFVTILIGMLLTAGCGKAKESNVTVGNKVPQLDTSTETSKKKTKGSDKKQESEEKINEMFENTSKGFLYKETIYRVKKND